MLRDGRWDHGDARKIMLAVRIAFQVPLNQGAVVPEAPNNGKYSLKKLADVCRFSASKFRVYFII